MSDTPNVVDFRAELSGWATQLTHMFCIDLKHMPEGCFNESHGGKARTVADIVAEVSGLNMMVVGILNGATPAMPSDEERAAYTASLNNAEACINAIRSSGEAIAQAIKDTSEATFAEMTTAPWGMSLTKYQFANIVVNNMWYHDGQLNYLQSLHGDDQVHWMEG